MGEGTSCWLPGTDCPRGPHGGGLGWEPLLEHCESPGRRRFGGRVGLRASLPLTAPAAAPGLEDSKM